MAGDPRGPIEGGPLLAPPRMESVTNYPPPLDAGVLNPGVLDAGVGEAPLAVAVESLSTREILWVERVLGLGGGVDETATALFEHRYGREPLDPERRAGGLRGDERFADPREIARPAEVDDAHTLAYLRLSISHHFRAYLDETQDEFDGMTQLVRNHFVTLESYRALRPMYCAVGIDDPMNVVFKHLVMSQFLGRDVVVHQTLANQLADLEETLEDKMPGLSDMMAREVESAGGFAPRLVANTRSISNHALGLAIDINAPNNKHIVKKPVIALIKDITKTEAFPDGFDFGKVLVKPEDQQLVGHAAREEKLQRLTETHARAQQASDLLRDWLTEQLEREKKAEFDLAQLKKDVDEWRARIVNAADQAEAESYRADYEQAELTLTTETAKWDSDGGRQRLEALRKAVGEEETIQLWAKEGLRNLPLDLVVALVMDLSFTWGDEWKDSKDGMHFDFERNAGGSVIIPKENFRSLEDVLEGGPDGM